MSPPDDWDEDESLKHIAEDDLQMRALWAANGVTPEHMLFTMMAECADLPDSVLPNGLLRASLMVGLALADLIEGPDYATKPPATRRLLLRAVAQTLFVQGWLGAALYPIPPTASSQFRGHLRKEGTP